MKIITLLATLFLGWAITSPAGELEPDYGFAPKIDVRRSLGLGKKEVLLADFSAVSSYKKEGHDYELYVLKLAIAGMLNRHGPTLWLDFVPYMGGPNSGVGADSHWRAYYAKQHGYTYHRVGEGLDALLKKTAHAFHGLILYDCRGDEPSDNMFLAMNLAGLNDCLPVSRRTYEKHKPAFEKLPVVARAEKLGWNRKQIYEWMIEHLLPRTDRTTVHSAAMTLGDIHLGDSNHYLQGLDYAFYRQCFIFNLSYAASPTKQLEMPISGDPVMVELIEKILAQIEPPAPILGWGEPEHVYCGTISQFGHYVNCTAAAPNLSFHAGVKPLQPPPYRQDTRPKLDQPGKKVYLAFVANEGDAIKGQALLYNKAWIWPGRGRVPINWAVNGANVELFPAVMEYFHRTKTDNDYFVAAPSGGGYTTPYAHPDLSVFLKHTARVMPLMDLREVEIWYPTMPALDQFARELPMLRGLSVTPHPARPFGEQFFTHGRRVPVMRYSPTLMYWILREPLLTGGQPDSEKLIAFLDKVYSARSLPALVGIYGVQGHRANQLADVVERLDPAKFEAVDYATFFHLAAQVQAGEITAANPAEAKRSWSPELIHQIEAWAEHFNDAMVTATENGLRVEVAPGKTWAVAAVPELQLPADAGGVRLRLGSLQGDGAQWVMKVHGDLGGFGLDEDWFFQGSAGGITTQRKLDPRIRRRLDRPWRLQLGIAGPEGSFVVFEDLQFLTQSHQ